MLEFLDNISYVPLIFITLALGLAPFFPEPHLVEKLRMLFNGNLSKPIDIFDLLMHSSPMFILGIKMARDHLF